MMKITITAIVSGMLATAVSRWRQKCSVPEWAAPSPRTRESGVGYAWRGYRSQRTSHRQQAENPQQHGDRDRTDQIGCGEPFALNRSEAAAGVPDQMANAAQHVMD